MYLKNLTIAGFTAWLYWLYGHSFEQKLQNLALKTKIQLVLGRHNHVVGYKQQMKAFLENEQVSLTQLASAGHNIMIDQPEYVYDLFDKFTQNLKIEM